MYMVAETQSRMDTLCACTIPSSPSMGYPMMSRVYEGAQGGDPAASVAEQKESLGQQKYQVWFSVTENIKAYVSKRPQRHVQQVHGTPLHPGSQLCATRSASRSRELTNVLLVRTCFGTGHSCAVTGAHLSLSRL